MEGEREGERAEHVFQCVISVREFSVDIGPVIFALAKAFSDILMVSPYLDQDLDDVIKLKGISDSKQYIGVMTLSKVRGDQACILLHRKFAFGIVTDKEFKWRRRRTIRRGRRDTCHRWACRRRNSLFGKRTTTMAQPTLSLSLPA